MKKKQIIGLVVASFIFIITGIIGVATNYYFNEKTTEAQNKLLSDTKNLSEFPSSPFVGVVRVEGEISDTSASSMLSSSQEYNHLATLDYIDKLADSSYNEGILLYVDSPGGNTYETAELYNKLMDYKDITGRPIWAATGSYACSGGYYICMAADKIISNENGITGSIGVRITLMDASKLYKKLGIEEVDITSGENKAMGSSAVKLTDEQTQIYQDVVDEAYDQFVGVVEKGRGLSNKEVISAADGRIYTSKQALDLKLIDELGTFEDAQNEFLEYLGDDNIIFYEKTEDEDYLSTFLNMFNSAYTAIKSSSVDYELQEIEDFLNSKGNGVIRYYAEVN